MMHTVQLSGLIRSRLTEMVFLQLKLLKWASMAQVVTSNACREWLISQPFYCDHAEGHPSGFAALVELNCYKILLWVRWVPNAYYPKGGTKRLIDSFYANLAAISSHLIWALLMNGKNLVRSS